MMLILAVALLPLGVIAIFASIDAARTNRASDEIEAHASFALAAQRLSSAFAEAGTIVRVASGAISDADPVSAARACERASQQLSDGGRYAVRFALYSGGSRAMCRTQGFEPPEVPMLPSGHASASVRILRGGEALGITIYAPAGNALGYIELPATLLTVASRPDPAPLPLELELIGNGGVMKLFDNYDGSAAREVTLSTNLWNDRLQLQLRAAGRALSIFEIVMVLLPVLLWLVAAIIGWLVVQRLLVQPLVAMQRAISAYVPGEANSFEAPRARSPAREISDLGDAFDQVTRTVAKHEADLEAGIERQKLLVREVHHRVKNNLQVVASLLNIHSRGSASEEVAAAYASIQRRVDALAVVHRNHYAELETTPGVPLRALISELGASLRASAPAGAARMQIRLALEPVYANQDVAVSVAFLVTETVEFAMLCGDSLISIALEPEEPGRARLSFEAAALTETADCPPELRDRFERIVTGLGRQLRSALDRDMEQGRLSLLVSVIGDEATPA